MPDQQFTTYAHAWYTKMTQIWQDRIAYYGIHHTGALLASVRGGHLTADELTMTAEFTFLQYGIYVDRGTGRGYKRGNGGDLHFLGKDYRAAHHLGRARQARPWFTPSWHISCLVISHEAARAAGTLYAATITTLQ